MHQIDHVKLQEYNVTAWNFSSPHAQLKLPAGQQDHLKLATSMDPMDQSQPRKDNYLVVLYSKREFFHWLWIKRSTHLWCCNKYNVEVSILRRWKLWIHFKLTKGLLLPWCSNEHMLSSWWWSSKWRLEETCSVDWDHPLSLCVLVISDEEAFEVLS